jgi:glycosyltransferase involved in cell wall biosynthesis
MVPRKGIDFLLQAIKQAVQARPDVVFRIGGDGSRAGEYKRLGKHLEIDKYLRWLGSLTREEARQEYQACDCFVLPSRYETMGVVYAEAMACGKPVIATRCGGPESIVSRNSGMLVEVENVKELAESIVYMMRNVGKYNGGAIREECLRKFSKEVVVRQILEAYRGSFA